MANNSNKSLSPIRPIFRPDYSELDHIYKEYPFNNDIDIMVQNSELRNMFDGQLIDMSVDSPQLSDEEFCDNWIGKEFEPDEIRDYILRPQYSSDKENSKSD